jgi:hypothetical protein
MQGYRESLREVECDFKFVQFFIHPVYIQCKISVQNCTVLLYRVVEIIKISSKVNWLISFQLFPRNFATKPPPPGPDTKFPSHKLSFLPFVRSKLKLGLCLYLFNESMSWVNDTRKHYQSVYIMTCRLHSIKICDANRITI